MHGWDSSYALSSSLLVLVAIVHRNQMCKPAKIAPDVRKYITDKSITTYTTVVASSSWTPLCAVNSLVISDRHPLRKVFGPVEQLRTNATSRAFPAQRDLKAKISTLTLSERFAENRSRHYHAASSSIFGNLIQCISADVTNLPDSRNLGAMYLYPSVTNSLQSRYPPNLFYQDGTFT
jgi:hypothetical protein